MISFIIPTRDRAAELNRTLEALGRLTTPADSPFGVRECEVIVIDNASAAPAHPPDALANAMPVRTIRLRSNLAAAARNLAADAARNPWIVMLDDDSAPDDGALLSLLSHVPDEVVALCADIRVPDRGREAGGLPEVPVGCGVAYRRDVFGAVGGYDSSFSFYAEEYDLAAKLIRRFAEAPGPVIVHEPRFRVTHRKVTSRRSMDTILRHLVRNNAWTIQRYTPDAYLDAALAHTLERYHHIALKENALAGYDAGRRDLEESLADQPRAPLPLHLYDRFTGLAAARAHLSARHAELGFETVRIVQPGKNEWAIRQALAERGVTITTDLQATAVIGTLSPGPLLDAHEASGGHAVMPWDPRAPLVYARAGATLAA